MFTERHVHVVAHHIVADVSNAITDVGLVQSRVATHVGGEKSTARDPALPPRSKLTQPKMDMDIVVHDRNGRSRVVREYVDGDVRFVRDGSHPDMITTVSLGGRAYGPNVIVNGNLLEPFGCERVVTIEVERYLQALNRRREMVLALDGTGLCEALMNYVLDFLYG